MSAPLTAAAEVAWMQCRRVLKEHYGYKEAPHDLLDERVAEPADLPQQVRPLGADRVQCTDPRLAIDRQPRRLVRMRLASRVRRCGALLLARSSARGSRWLRARRAVGR